MAKFFDAEGNEVEAFTTEEVAAQAQTVAEAALEKYKAENPQKEDVVVAPADTTPDPVAELTKTVKTLQDTIRSKEIKEIARTYAPGDVEKQKVIEQNFGRLTGFEETPEGFSQQAEAAARMSGVDTTGVSVGDVSGTGGGRNIDIPGQKQQTEVDKNVQTVLGITPEMVEKYSGKVSESNES